jgi:hypothetical protein
MTVICGLSKVNSTFAFNRGITMTFDNFNLGQVIIGMIEKDENGENKELTLANTNTTVSTIPKTTSLPMH